MSDLSFLFWDSNGEGCALRAGLNGHGMLRVIEPHQSLVKIFNGGTRPLALTDGFLAQPADDRFGNPKAIILDLNLDKLDLV